MATSLHKNEPRLFAHLSQDPVLRQTFVDKRDPYATIYAPAVHKDYWECMEHWEDGSPNFAGKQLRKKGKTLMLGIMYGMGANLMSQQLKVSFEECQEILKNFYEKFPKIKEFVDGNAEAAKEQGYVEDYLGRRRHLPDAQLPEVKVTAHKKVNTNCDLFLDCQSNDTFIEVEDKEATKRWTDEYNANYAGKGFKTKTKFKDIAKANGISVLDNGAFISKTMTQCTNARIQGSASSLTKKAMVNIFKDSEMQRLGFKLLIPVHDELLGECPLENAEEVSERLGYLMSHAAQPEVDDVPFVTDPYVLKRWYADEMLNEIQEYISTAVEKEGKTREQAIAEVKAEHTEFSDEVLNKFCDGTYDVLRDEV